MFCLVFFHRPLVSSCWELVYCGSRLQASRFTLTCGAGRRWVCLWRATSQHMPPSRTTPSESQPLKCRACRHRHRHHHHHHHPHHHHHHPLATTVAVTDANTATTRCNHHAHPFSLLHTRTHHLLHTRCCHCTHTIKHPMHNKTKHTIHNNTTTTTPPPRPPHALTPAHPLFTYPYIHYHAHS